MPGLFGDMFDDAPSQPAPSQPTARQVSTRSASSQSNLYKMPFGKHKGEPVMELPLDYLIWLWWKREGDPLRDPLAANVFAGLKSYGIDPEGDAPEQRNTR